MTKQNSTKKNVNQAKMTEITMFKRTIKDTFGCTPETGAMTSIILSQCSTKHTRLGQDTSHTEIGASLCVKEFREKREKCKKMLQILTLNYNVVKRIS